jgi:hypothetical protein
VNHCPFFCNLKMLKMKIKKKYLNSKVFQPIIRQFVYIEDGNESKYYSLGLDIFETEKKPKLSKKNDKTRKKSIDIVRNDINGVDNNIES